MNNFKLTISAAAGIIGGLLTELFGGWNYDIRALIIFMGIDFMTGLLCAAFFGKSDKSKNGGLSAAACWRGIGKKIVTLLLVAVANQADILLNTEYLRSAMVIAFCASEVISICENAGLMGVLPEPVQKILDKIIDLLNNRNGKGR